MKVWCISFLFLLLGLPVHTNESSIRSLNEANKLFIITLDGFRWQEVFNGADSLLISNTAFNNNVANAKALYWSSSKDERRKKLMPFFWNIIAQQGELYGNRTYGNKMNVANPYALSYPGYNELLTGHVDLSVFNNDEVANPNLSVLEMLNATTTYNGKVAAFTSWDAFPYILNKNKSSVYINSGFEKVEGQQLSPTEVFINSLQTEIEDKKNIRYDELTLIACREYIQKKKPSIVLLSFGGTDEAAHSKKYDLYLQQANNADRMIGELWHYLQTLPEYTNKTTFLITTDHGRGNSANWFTHGVLVSGSSQIWMGLLGNGVKPIGEHKKSGQLYLKNAKDMMLKILAY